MWKREYEGVAIEELRALTTEARFKRTRDAHLSRMPYLFTFESVDMLKIVAPSIPSARACTERNSPKRSSSRSNLSTPLHDKSDLNLYHNYH